MMISDQSKLSTSLKSEPELPPPYSYEDLYSSYQNEWDQQRKNDGTTKGGPYGNATSDTGSDTGISDLQWVTLQGNDSDCGTYLLACTDSGEVLAWKLTRSNKSSSDDPSSSNETDSFETTKVSAAVASALSASFVDTGPQELLEPHSRLTICVGENSDDDSFEKEGDYDRSSCSSTSSSTVLQGMCVVGADTLAANGSEDEGVSPQNTKKHKGPRKRQRSNDEKENTTTNANNERQLLIVAGEGGLWSIPLREVLTQHPWKPSSLCQPDSPPLSLVRLSDRSILKLQSPQPPPIQGEESSKGEPQTRWLFALEQYNNLVSMWSLSTILSCHSHSNENSIARGVVAEKQIDLSRCFSSAFASINPSKSKLKSRPSKRRKIRERTGENENATTILVVPYPADSDEGHGICLLVGTDRSRLWILPVPNKTDDNDETSMIFGTSKSRFFSLNDGGKSSVSEHPSQPKRQGGNRRSTSPRTPVWKTTDILETNKSTWWTVSATTNSNGTANSGLLVTWHAPTGMVVARQETREALQAIQHNQYQMLYSVANEGAITAWDSSFRLARKGRFWSSPPSSKTLAISRNDTIGSSDADDSSFQKMMAVAGVGNKVDLFLDHCRVQTVRI